MEAVSAATKSFQLQEGTSGHTYLSSGCLDGQGRPLACLFLGLGAVLLHRLCPRGLLLSLTIIGSLSEANNK